MAIRVYSAFGTGGKVSNFFLIFGGAWLFFSLPFLAAGYFMLKSDNLYETEGKIATAKILSKYVSYGGSKSKTKYYNIRYQFNNERGDIVEGEDSVAKALYDTLGEGGQISIVYIPGDSGEKNRAVNSSSNDALSGYIFMGAGALQFLLGVCFIVPNIRKRFRYKRLQTEGTLVEAEVTSCGPGGLVMNGVPQWTLEYTFQDHYGRSHSGRSEYMSPAEGQRFKRGDKGKARYDKKKPSISMWVA